MKRSDVVAGENRTRAWLTAWLFDDEDPAIAREQMRLSLDNLGPSVIALPAFGGLICFMFSMWVPYTPLMTWWCVVVVGTIPVAMLCLKHAKGETKSIPLPRLQLIARSSHSLYALTWASMGYFLWTPAPENQSLLLALISGSLAGNMALCGPSRAIAMNGYFIHGTALVLLSFSMGGFVGAVLGTVAIAFVGYLMFMSMSIYDTGRRMIELAKEKTALIEEKNRLIVELTSEKLASDRANKAKSEFLANMSHELRTPLNAIIGFGEMLELGMLPEKTVHYAGIVRRSGHHLLSLISDILDLSKIDAGKLSLTETDVDLGFVLRDCIDLTQTRARDGALEVTCRLAPESIVIRADQRAIRQIVLNLVSNAIKFTRPGGQVEIVAEMLAANEVRILVRDNGVGIRKADQERVFESFGQGRHDVVSAERGTGLGLPIVRGLVEAHGGRVTLESAVGKGTTVSVTLPGWRYVAGAVRAA